MTYEQARQIKPGERLRTVYGETGTVQSHQDTGWSRIFVLQLDRNHRCVPVHNDKCFPVEG